MSTVPSTETLPTGWKVSSLGDVAKWGSGGTPKANNLAYYGGTIPWVIIGDLNDGVVSETANSITQLGLDESSAKLVPQGTLLIAMYGSIGKLGIAGMDLATNQAIAFAAPMLEIVTSEYLFQYLASQKEIFLASGKGMTQQNISQTMLKSWPIPVPPLAEQRKIVEILEEQLSRLDAALASVRAVREKSARFRRSLLHAAFNGALTGHDTSDGTLPDGWVQKQLGEIADVGWGDLQVTKSSYVSNGYLAYSATGADGFLDYFDFDEDGIVLSAIGAGCGRTWYAKGRWSCIKNTMRILEKSKEVNLRFLFQHLSDPEAWPKRGSGQPFISQKDARELEVIIPPLAEQEKIVRILEEQLSRLDASLVVANLIEKKASALRRSLLHAAFTGNLTKEWREGAHV